ncbi:MAG TPA: universal stress protein [Bryobacteraceae bacterium]|jgi:nucleotide-binding universal stress UspA family protein|nr:universal stress protein [Bryobacteraceae bacterium]
MLPLPKILVPVDFSESARGAVRWAGYLGCRLRSELTLLHVACTADEDQWRRRAEGLLETLLPGEMRCPNARPSVRSGDPAEEIAALARRENSSLIVMATHGDGPFHPLVLGSVASAILRDVHCPVVTGIHRRNSFPAATPRIQNILCAVELGEEGANALKWAARLAGEFKARLVLVHITPSSEGGDSAYFDPERRRYWVTEARQENFAACARRRLEEMQRAAGANAGILIQSSMDVPRAVCEAAARMASDLVVIGRGPAMSPAGRLRTTAGSIIRQAPCPVLSV